MSREVRRVPVDWQHPTEPNPYWVQHAASSLARNRTLSRLHMPQVRFVGLVGDYPEALSSWEQELADLRERRGHSWEFSVEYHLTGYQGQADSEPVVHPFYRFTDDDTEQSVAVRDEDHLHELAVAQKIAEKPDPAHYMPVFQHDEDALGWCLYETVSEGTPITPVFATAVELIDHLATEGDDWKQEPWRREAAETLVRQGFSFGTFVAVGGVGLLDSARDADRIGGAS